MLNQVVYSVFYLRGGWANFVCQSIVGVFSFEEAEKQVLKLRNQGYKSMSVKNGKIIGGLCSYSDFNTDDDRKEYFNSIV